ncbi:amino acid adenylation domain-containing protein [Flavobacteriaceae bacterium]|nr:amino acid adenylation domain-containing protein [Flavobacteriaceae bacterium]
MKKELLKTLLNNGVSLKVVSGNLKINAPKGVLTKELVAQIKANKEYLMQKLVSSFEIPKAAISEKYVITPTQYFMWFTHEFLGGNRAYNITSTLLLKGKLDVAILQKAFNKVIQRHESLRTYFQKENETIYQCIRAENEVEFSLETVTLKTFTKTAIKAEVKAEYNTSFQLDKDILLKAKLISSENKEHILLFVIHHIISDGWSLQLLTKEVIQQYQSIVNNTKLVLPNLDIQYKDYSVWLHEQIKSKAFENKLAFWKDTFATPTSVLELSHNKNRPANKTYEGKIYSHKFPRAFQSILNTYTKENQVTLFMLLIGGLNGLFYKYTGETDITLGTTVAGRDHSDLEHQIGLFSNALPIRSKFDETDSFLQFMTKQKSTLLKIYENKEYPFTELVKQLNLSKDSSRSPLFDIMVLLQNHRTIGLNTESGIQGIEASEYNEIERGVSQMDATFIFVENNENLSLTVEYNTAIFTEAFVINCIHHFENFLTNGVNVTAESINEISILSKEEKNKLLSEFNVSNVEISRDFTLLELLQNIIEEYPNNIALQEGIQSFTYVEFDKITSKLAEYLIETFHIETGDFIAIELERSTWTIITMIAVLKTGGIYVPIDVDYPESRKAYIKEDSKCKTVIDASVFRSFEAYKSVNSAAARKITSTDLAYVIYTSGSTGKPKGVQITHASLADYAITFREYFGVTANDKILQQASISFDTSVEEIFPILISGGTLVIHKSKEDFNSLLHVCETHGISILSTNPFVLEYLNRNYENYNFKFRALISGGDVVKPSDIDNIYQKVNVYNTYGPTESTVCATYHHIQKLEVSISIGKPIRNRQIYILTSNTLQLTPIGIIGEICVGGKGLSKGYLNKQELTQEKFIQNPFQKGELLYRTGDLGKWLPDGSIEFIGRKDNQVKIRGYRIELGEIENALSNIEEIQSCCVLTKEDSIENKRLVGYVVTEKGFDKEKIQKELKQTLPDYMIPQLWVELNSMPLTTNGKLDRKSLPELDGSGLANKEHVAPRNDTEIELAVIWQELLGLERVGVYDNFFELGGHSLLATRLVSMIRKELEIEVSIRDIFEHTTISSLGTHLSFQSEYVLLPTIVVEKRPIRIPLSFSQERLWFLDQLEGTLAYHIPIVTRLEGALDILLLEQTLQKIIFRHEVLRTNLLSEEGIGYQEVIEAKSWSLDQEIIKDRDLLTSHLESYLMEPFNLSSDYKLRSCLYDLGNNQFVLACIFHHIASDGWSSRILMHEFTEIYNSLQSGQVSSLSELSLQYSDYAIWQRRYLEGKVLDSQLDYWEEKLRGISTLYLPTDYFRPPVQSTLGASVSLSLDKELSDSLVILCQQEGVTLFMVLISAFKVLLSRYSGQDDICVGTPIANRTQLELEGMIGFFVNTLALRSDLSANPSFNELLKQVKKTTLEGYDHQLVSFEKVVDRVVVTRDMSRSPLFQVMFVLQNTPDMSEGSRTGIQGVIISDYEFDIVTSQFDLTLNVSESEKGLRLDMNYCTALFDKATVNRMLSHYLELLVSIVNDITQPIASLSMHANQEELQLLEAFNATEVAYPKNKTVVDLFEDQVKKTPKNIAVVFEGEELSYKELDRRSNQLARYLRSKGVEPDDLVGICLDRSLEMIIGILGILKSGGAYVPIDPKYPKERIDYMIDDAGIGLLLSDTDSFDTLGKLSEVLIVLLDKDWDIISDLSSRRLSKVLSPKNLAYVIYTSGSTGKPKGVLIEHGNVTRLFKHESCLYDFDSNDVWTMFHSFCFDFSVWEMYGALLNGGRLVIVPEYITKDAIYFKKLLIKEGVTILNQTPSSFYALQEEFLSGNFEHSLRYVIFGGEALNSIYLGKWKDFYPGCRMVNMYGITETTVHVTYKEIMKSDTKSLISNIGSAIPTLECYIVDGYLNLVPIGVEGELCVGGAGVARGYLNREELTNEKFVVNPFNGNGRLYKTGDLARWLPDGNIEFLGRNDDQVKIRGYRIELGEIEHKLIDIVEIVQSCVISKERETESGTNKYLVGYYVLEATASGVTESIIRSKLSEVLPDYMVPSALVEMESFPLTINGKLDKKSLPDVDFSSSDEEYVAPITETEIALCICNWSPNRNRAFVISLF